MVSDHLPYVVSSDISLLLKRWTQSAGLTMPKASFLQNLRDEFETVMRQIFPNFDFIDEGELVSGMAEHIQTVGMPCITLDLVYSPGPASLEFTRTVDSEGNDTGIQPRGNAPSVDIQLQKIQKLGITGDVVLADDVLFTGSLLDVTIKVLDVIGISVCGLVAGIGIGDGIEYAKSIGLEVYAVREYKNGVIDEVCERDFYPGIPLCGRSIPGPGNFGMPYLLPFGKPEDWASIPKESTVSFSKFCIKQSIKLFTEIENLSNKTILCASLERRVHLLSNSDRFVNALYAQYEQL